MKINKTKKYSLVLSGGGALGIAQLPVLKKLEKNKIKYNEIIGTSIGAIIGASIAIGLTVAEDEKFFKEFSKITNWIKFSMDGNSIIKSKKIEDILYLIFKDKKMADTNIPLKIICTELETGNIKVFDKEDDVTIVDALLATIAIPGIFEEKIINDVIYVDGFLTQNLGILESTWSDIIAIDVLGINSYKNNMPDNFFKTKNVIEMFEKSMKLLIINQTKQNIKILREYESFPVSLHIIDVDTSGFKTYNFNKFDELIKLNKNVIDFV